MEFGNEERKERSLTEEKENQGMEMSKPVDAIWKRKKEEFKASTPSNEKRGDFNNTRGLPVRCWFFLLFVL